MLDNSVKAVLLIFFSLTAILVVAKYSYNNGIERATQPNFNKGFEMGLNTGIGEGIMSGWEESAQFILKMCQTREEFSIENKVFVCMPKPKPKPRPKEKLNHFELEVDFRDL